ncbi:MAG: M28 family peptidase [Flavobacterium lindanitolerans]|uniref:M28 family metallopeptidase n=1 Tax=Flavobacterium TaxID=237 RepID=UPI00095EA0E8|nr:MULTISPECIES: M28 family metallopeptidase [Flavobacterium]MBL7868582.1 M28 family peptidase [Flavobacterium lindanitolerans]MDQ7962381.1 M28 family metallopeptidase [Flavobacterium lindanitolerans]OJX54493.1 MAG: peptidase M28 [Flavobacterium sp. 38-13]THD33674.1 MAG: M28 family peptidase [Flavobacterium johnsoniae]
MKKMFVSGFMLSLFLVSCSSVKPTKYMEAISASDLKTNLYVIAGDEMEGRNTGEPGQKKAGKYLISQYEKIGVSYPKGATDFYQKVPAAFMSRAFSPKLNDSENIWAFIEGSEKPDEILVISAHYDHVGMKNGQVYNGADDDGSGTVALLEIAKAFMLAKKDGHGPKRSILFLHVTGEEHGLHGSRYYVEHPLFPLKNTIADLNIDMIGRRDDKHKDNGNYVYLIGSDRLSTDLHKISENANKEYTKLELDYKYNDRNDPERIYYRSDHYNFAKNGIPSLFYFNGVHEDYHKATDTPDKIEYDLLQKRAQLVFVTAWELANRKERPVIDRDGK